MNKLESALSPLVKIGLKSVLIFGVPTKANKVDDASVYVCVWGGGGGGERDYFS